MKKEMQEKKLFVGEGLRRYYQARQIIAALDEAILDLIHDAFKVLAQEEQWQLSDSEPERTNAPSRFYRGIELNFQKKKSQKKLCIWAGVDLSVVDKVRMYCYAYIDGKAIELEPTDSFRVKKSPEGYYLWSDKNVKEAGFDFSKEYASLLKVVAGQLCARVSP